MSGVFLTASAQNALTLLRGIDKNIQKTETAISTGRTVNSAADNPVLYALSQQLSTQQSDFLAVQDTVSLGSATVSVAREAAESIGDLLSEVRSQVVLAQAVGANTTDIQSSIDNLVSQIDSLAAAANFNGVNLLTNNGSTDDASLDVLGAVYTDSDGAVKTSNITVSAQDLRTAGQTVGSTAAAEASYVNGYSGAETISAGGGTYNLDILNNTVEYGASYSFQIAGAGGLSFGTETFEYVARNGDTNADVATAIYNQVSDYIDANDLGDEMSVALDTSNGRVTFTNNDAADDFTLTATATTGGTAGGGLRQLTDIDVSTTAGQNAALASIDTLISSTTDKISALGSAENRMSIQMDFLSNTSTAVSMAINDLIGADLTAESARLAALDAQRQLALQTLSMTNNRFNGALALLQTMNR